MKPLARLVIKSKSQIFASLIQVKYKLQDFDQVIIIKK